MFITHPPRQTHENAPTSPCNHGKENTRATSADAPQANVGGSRAIVEGTHPRQGTVGGSAPTPTGRGLERFSRHVFMAFFGLFYLIFAEIRENLRDVFAMFRP